MSFVSSVIIGMIEKELSAQAPEIAEYAIKAIGSVAADIVDYVEKKISSSPAPAQAPSAE
jgi:hypothetical protein